MPETAIHERDRQPVLSREERAARVRVALADLARRLDADGNTVGAASCRDAAASLCGVAVAEASP